MGASVYRIGIGFAISSLLALPIGLIMGTYKIGEGFFEPPIDLIRYMPAVAFIPLAIIWVGTGDGEKFMILFIGIFFQEVLLIMDNVKAVPRTLINVAYTFGLRQWEVLLQGGLARRAARHRRYPADHHGLGLDLPGGGRVGGGRAGPRLPDHAGAALPGYRQRSSLASW